MGDNIKKIRPQARGFVASSAKNLSLVKCEASRQMNVIGVNQWKP